MPKIKDERAKEEKIDPKIDPIDLSEWLALYEKHLLYERGLSPLTIQAYQQDITHFLGFINEKISKRAMRGLSHINIEIIYGYVNALTFLYKQKEYPIKETTKERKIVSIKLFLKFYAREMNLEFPFLDELIIKKTQSFFPELVDIERVKEALSEYETSNGLDWEQAGSDLSKNSKNKNKRKKLYRDFLILSMLYGMGARVSELSNLTLQSVREEKDFITLDGKGNKSRKVPPHPSLIEKIEIYLHYVRPLFLKPKLKAANSFKNNSFLNSYFFLNSRGEKLSRISIWKIIKSFTKKAGWGDGFSPHSFRHMYATHLLRQGAEIRTLQQLLGHESISTTEKYTHLVNKDLEQTLKKYHPLYE